MCTFFWFGVDIGDDEEIAVGFFVCEEEVLDQGCFLEFELF